TLINQDFQEAFGRFDVLATPTSPTVAFPIGSRVDDPYAMYLSDICTLPASVAGLPSISVPCGESEGLPVGLQLIGNYWQEGRLISLAHAFEQESGRANTVAPI
ncbi:MAG: amidase family protein, partial [Dehalococcoidia bacterium]